MGVVERGLTAPIGPAMTTSNGFPWLKRCPYLAVLRAVAPATPRWNLPATKATGYRFPEDATRRSFEFGVILVA